MGVIERLREYIDFKGITKYKFYQETGLSNGFLDKNTNVGSDKCEKIIYQYPDISPEWLITGRGSMIRSDQPAQVSYEPTIGIPYYDVDFIAGFDQIFNDQTLLPAHNIVFKPFEKATLWCNVTGHSMEQKINHGDVIALKECTVDDVQYGEIYAVVLDTIRTVKILRKSEDPHKFRYVPVNKAEYDDQDFDKSRIIKIYEVLGNISKFF